MFSSSLCQRAQGKEKATMTKGSLAKAFHSSIPFVPSTAKLVLKNQDRVIMKPQHTCNEHKERENKAPVLRGGDGYSSVH